MLAACFSIFASATETAATAGDGKVNAAIGATLLTEGDIAGSFTKHDWEIVFDEIKIYDADISLTYCDTMFAPSSSKASIIDGTYTNLYNHKGEVGMPDSKYLFFATFEMRTTYLIDSLAIYAQIFYPDKGVANMNSFDGFDLWASMDGEEYTLIHSATELVCGKKWTAGDEDPNTAMYRADLETPFEAKYFTLCISQPRCFNADFAAANELTAATNVQYFRLAELELLGTMTGELPIETTEEETTKETPDETTKDKETTTKAPDTTTKTPDADTKAPDTTEPAPDGCGSTVAPFSVAALLIGTACVIKKKKD